MKLCFVLLIHIILVEEQELIAKNNLGETEKEDELKKKKFLHKQELKQFDKSLVMQLDQKVSYTCNFF